MAEAEEAAAPEPAKKGKFAGKKKLIVIAAAALVVLGGGGAAGAYFMGMFGHSGADSAEKAEAAKAAKPSEFVNLPDMLVNIESGEKKPRYLKLSVALEVKGADQVEKVNAALPKVVDEFQTFLRELRVDDLRGSAGVYRLREELRDRITVAAAPAQVDDVLFRELLIQ